LIRWSIPALKAYQAIYDHIAKDSQNAARKQCRLILNAIDRLDSFHHSGRVGIVSDTREVVVPKTPYIVYYRLRENTVMLLSIRHAARQRPRRFDR
jgi:toxin ParE1/3/4